MQRLIREARPTDMSDMMQHNILKYGFTYCGIIYLASGDERLAYQRIKNLS